MQEVEVSMRLLGCTFPPEEQLEAALFTPPLAKQRCQLALDLIATTGADSVVPPPLTAPPPLTPRG